LHRAGFTVDPLDTRLIERLTDPAAFDHPTSSVQRIETHISWVILTDRYAYKIKKPLVLDFLDFGDLARRKFYCEEEVRLNKPWAPDIYLDVVAITGDGNEVRFGGDGVPVEYAVRMWRFDENLRLDRQLANAALTEDDMRELGQAVAARHLAAPVANARFRERYLQSTIAQIRDNFAVLDGLTGAVTLASLREWTEAELLANDATLGQRFDQGFVRDCHGDLHLANLVRMPGGIRSFDCIEFSEDLRRIDITCDVAFLAMDLVAKGRHDLAALFFNRYLECCGDYGGIALLDLYFVYRCLVRAKVAVIRSRECKLHHDKLASLADADRYCRIALRQTWKPAPLLIVMHGLSGSGKTWVSSRLMAALPAIRVRSDIERKRLFGLPEFERSDSGVGEGIYSRPASDGIYAHLFETAKLALDARHSVIIDATFLTREQRAAAFEFADYHGYSMCLVDVTAPDSLRRKRLNRRELSDIDASEAGVDVLDHQHRALEPFTSWERERSLSFENVDDADISPLVDAILSRHESR
jgi:hypothetical protein